jgi:hypothetical protein
MRIKQGAAFLMLAAMTGTIASPLTARADDSSKTQKQKNDWRNLAIGAGVIAGHGLLNHNSTETLLGAAGAAYSAKRYEDARKQQSQQQNNRAYYHRNGNGEYTSGNRKYYWYNGHRYYQDLNTGSRVMMY